MRTVACHDCGKPVSLSARQCAQCGSREFAGPYPVSKNSGVESRNDRNMILMMAAFGAIGGLYGVKAGASWMTEILGGVVYAFVGIIIAVPIAFAINVTRNWR
jgi:hypothetical protein